MGALFWLILAQPVVLVLANNDTMDTYTNTSLFFVEEYDDHDYSLLEEEDTETSTGDYFEDLILSRLESIDQTYDPFPISFILTFNKPVINIFLILFFKVPQDLDKARQIAFARVFQNWQVSVAMKILKLYSKALWITRQCWVESQITPQQIGHR